MNVERLTRLKTILQAVSVENKPFNMEQWFDITLPTLTDMPFVPCGTAACALGWACLDPAFAKQGLGIESVVYAAASTTRFQPVYQGHKSFHAGAAFFDISYRDSEFLFDNHAYDDRHRIEPEDVIRRIDYLLTGDGPYDVIDEDC